MEKYYPIAQTMAHGDKDLQQELVLSVMDTVGKRKIYDEGLIINRMVLQRKMYKTGYQMVDKYGSSIDNGHVRNRKDVTVFPYDTARERGSRDEIIDIPAVSEFNSIAENTETAKDELLI